jgi:hypothetical protein
MKTQSNITNGSIARVSAADLSDKEGRFVVLTSNGQFDLAGANPTAPLYVLLDGGKAGEVSTAEPVTSGKRYRVRGSNANFTAGSRVTSGANGLAVLVTLVASGANLVTLAGVVEETNNIATADTGEVLILGFPQIGVRA